MSTTTMSKRGPVASTLANDDACFEPYCDKRFIFMYLPVVYRAIVFVLLMVNFLWVWFLSGPAVIGLCAGGLGSLLVVFGVFVVLRCRGFPISHDAYSDYIGDLVHEALHWGLWLAIFWYLYMYIHLQMPAAEVIVFGPLSGIFSGTSELSLNARTLFALWSGAMLCVSVSMYRALSQVVRQWVRRFASSRDSRYVVMDLNETVPAINPAGIKQRKRLDDVSALLQRNAFR